MDLWVCVILHVFNHSASWILKLTFYAYFFQRFAILVAWCSWDCLQNQQRTFQGNRSFDHKSQTSYLILKFHIDVGIDCVACTILFWNNEAANIWLFMKNINMESSFYSIHKLFFEHEKVKTLTLINIVCIYGSFTCKTSQPK